MEPGSCVSAFCKGKQGPEGARHAGCHARIKQHSRAFPAAGTAPVGAGPAGDTPRAFLAAGPAPVGAGAAGDKVGGHPAGRAKLRQARGFTLLELLIVLAIIALGTSLIIPAIGSAENKMFAAEVRNAVSALNYARRIAIARSTPTVATFRYNDPAGFRGFSDESRPTGAATRLPAWESDGISLAFRTTPDEEAELREEVEILFFPQGGSTGGILEFRQEERRATVRIDPLTGRIDAGLGEDP